MDNFIANGPLGTSTRSLSSALKLQSAGLYYYFASKDDVVVLCAEGAAIRLEDALITPALKDIGNTDFMMKRLQSRADEIAPTMRFLASVCTSKCYKDSVRPVLDRLTERYEYYAEFVAKKMDCAKDEVEPYVLMMITAVANYKIFAGDGIIAP